MRSATQRLKSFPINQYSVPGKQFHRVAKSLGFETSQPEIEWLP